MPGTGDAAGSGVGGGAKRTKLLVHTFSITSTARAGMIGSSRLPIASLGRSRSSSSIRSITGSVSTGSLGSSSGTEREATMCDKLNSPAGSSQERIIHL